MASLLARLPFARTTASQAELALYLEVGPDPSPPSVRLSGMRTHEEVDDLVEMMQILHPVSNKGAAMAARWDICRGAFTKTPWRAPSGPGAATRGWGCGQSMRITRRNCDGRQAIDM